MLRGEYYKGFYTGGEEYQVRVDREIGAYYIYRIDPVGVNELVHTSCSAKNAEAYIEDLYYANVDYDYNL